MKPFQIRSRSFTAVVLRPAGAPGDAFYEALDQQLRQTPDFFANAPFVIDLDRAEGPDANGELDALLKGLRERGLSIFGVQNGSAEQKEAALASGLVLLQGGRDVPYIAQRGRSAPAVAPIAAAPVAAPQPAPAPEPEPEPVSALVLTEPVRSGQRIFADRGDLVVVAPVSSGAELIAHGNIHVYGRLRGRALAGVNGDRSARIFCQSLDAELIAIAGLYRTSEDLGPEVRKQRIQAFLREDTLCVEALK